VVPVNLLVSQRALAFSAQVKGIVALEHQMALAHGEVSNEYN